MSPASSPSVLRLVEYLCPAGHVVARLKEGLPYLGTPERVCGRCGRATTVAQYCEWADMTGTQRQIVVSRAILNTIAAGTGVGVALLTITGLVAASADLPEAQALEVSGIAFLVGPATVAALNLRRIRRSIARTVGNRSPHPGGG